CVYSSVASLCFRKLFVDINFYAAMALSFEPVMNNPGLTASRRRRRIRNDACGLPLNDSINSLPCPRSS
ncbi:MAG: hypothetical protein NT138_14240, partial [Planctomycetales bacterium]|nr:hypothetical protein [Planctomycetales bacterium]